jgi:hypothetical protein
MGAEPTRVEGADDYVLDLGEVARPDAVRSSPAPEPPEELVWRLRAAGVRAAAGSVHHPGARATLGLVLAEAVVAGAAHAAGAPAGTLAAGVLTGGLLLGLWTGTAPAAPIDVSPAERVAGRLLAAWGTALALLLPGLSVLLMSSGSWPAAGVTALFTGVAAAAGTAATTLRPRRRLIAALAAGAAVALLAAGPVLLYAALWASTATVETTLVREPRAVDFGALTTRTTGYDPNICGSRQVDVTHHHTERIWLLLGLSPYPTLADAVTGGQPHPAGSSRFGLVDARLGPELLVDRCDLRGAAARRAAELDLAGPSWPYGLVVDVLAAAAGLAAVVRRGD